MDIVDTASRSKMMAGIKNANTKPELIIRRALHKLGYRFKIHNSSLPGKPDIVLPKYGAIIFVNGCFWHGHGCHLFKWPSSRKNFWQEKIKSNCERDVRNLHSLIRLNWRVCVVWECAVRKNQSHNLSKVLDDVVYWIRGLEKIKIIASIKNNHKNG
jgi:DNA mismatch endonuclease (patch repair protein)